MTAVEKPEVLVLWPNRPKQMAILEERYRLHHYYRAADKAALLREAGPRVRAIVCSGEVGPDRAMIEACPRLEIVACYGVGVDAIDRVACARRAIPITNTPDVLTEDVADTALMLLLMAFREAIRADAWVRTGRWEREGPMPVTTSPRGRKVGIVGLGRIGTAIARRVEAIGMVVAGYCGRRPRPEVPYAFFPDPLALARAVEVLVLSCPGGPATRGLVNAAVLEALGPQGVLVNVARGSVVDEEALIEALERGTIKAAALDVFANEPRVPERLRRLENVVLSPHAASATFETRDKMAQLVVDNLEAHFAGRPLLTPVPPPRPGEA
ncbi:MAG: 2-hydroxyacid dehydrogenase [Geminicoccaceae bacterium]|nr:2-hydroxyacid dehydrogenase [Geminicoccaceae bacterium]